MVELTAVGFNGTSSIWEEVSAQLYLTDGGYLDLTFCHRYENVLRSLVQPAVKLQKYCIARTYQSFNPLYLASIGLQVPFKQLARLSRPKNLSETSCQVYHSTFFALPHRSLPESAERVLTVHDMIPLLYPQHFTSAALAKYKVAIDSIRLEQDWVICDSESTRQDFCKLVPMDPSRVFTAHLAAMRDCFPITDTELIDQILKQYKIPETPYFLTLSTLEPRKNLSVLIKSFLELIQADPSLDVNLVLVGPSGWKNNSLFQIIAEHPQLESRIFFTGYVPDRDLNALYSGCLSFVYPSLYEGFGLPPLEAMQCGAPVITSNTSSLPEVVGNAGIMVDPHSINELCQALWSVATDSSLRTDMRQQSIQQARQFSWQTCVDQVVDVYRLAAETSSK
ncbi:glycosyltransferase family 4 protein [Leptothoe spongobia]|uniref:Glycosyltransferase family 4 protein n=1 Tax=Leptothoe spongobia TAU-MAC 1115 TaxID=1967444 RepID=A0A947GIX8_9CYAN|nr:glycosyltransferase family 1 protein [Leptothoe spongobia]MBT9315237.1 glycosyltransferase family 4 protein [Leptothoe spongobia TAU-MAC 1115]